MLVTFTLLLAPFSNKKLRMHHRLQQPPPAPHHQLIGLRAELPPEASACLPRRWDDEDTLQSMFAAAAVRESVNVYQNLVLYDNQTHPHFLGPNAKELRTNCEGSLLLDFKLFNTFHSDSKLSTRLRWVA